MRFKDEQKAKEWLREKIEDLKEHGVSDYYYVSISDSRLRNELWLYGLLQRSHNSITKTVDYVLGEKFFQDIEKLEEWCQPSDISIE